MDVTISALVTITENPEKVTAAILNVFPEAIVELQEHLLVATTSCLDQFKGLLRNQKIQNTAGQVLHAAHRGSSLSFDLHKQAAYAGVINFAVVDHPLGNLHVTINDANIESLIDWLTEV